MSRLIVKGHKDQEFKLDVTQFRSPMTAQITSAQTRTMLQHFPIRAGQPDINFTVKFRSQDERIEFANFVRDHQLYAQANDNGYLTMWWPERDILNWTGWIIEYKNIERGFKDPAPSVTFGVALINSMMSERTLLTSFGSPFRAILGILIPQYRGDWAQDNLIRPPTPPSTEDDGPNAPAPYTGGGGRW